MSARYPITSRLSHSLAAEAISREQADWIARLAAKEQGATTNEINRNVEGIRLATEQTAKAAQQTSDASDTLNGQSATLHQFVAAFKG